MHHIFQIFFIIFAKNLFKKISETKKSANGRVIFQISNPSSSNVTVIAFNDDSCSELLSSLTDDKLDYPSNYECGKRMYELEAGMTTNDYIDNDFLDEHIQLDQNKWGFYAKYDGGISCSLKVSTVIINNN